MSIKKLNLPLLEEEIRQLNVGDVVYLTGKIFTSRDMGHLRIKDLLESRQPLPKDFQGSAIFHAGPVALKKEDGGWELSVIGPTTSIRMEPYAEMVGKLGVKAILGKGGMAEDTRRCCAEYGYVYLQAAPGCAAVLAEKITKVNDVLWLEMGMPEAMWELEADEFGPLVVGMDTMGKSIYLDLKTNAYDKLNELFPVQ